MAAGRLQKGMWLITMKMGSSNPVILTLHLSRSKGQDLADVWTYAVALRGGCLDLEDQWQRRIVAQSHDCDDGSVEGTCKNRWKTIKANKYNKLKYL